MDVLNQSQQKTSLSHTRSARAIGGWHRCLEVECRIIYGHNHCSEDLDGNEARFKVMAIGAGGVVIATQNGRFGGTVAAHGHVETKVFVSCDPDRVRLIRVEAR